MSENKTIALTCLVLLALSACIAEPEVAGEEVDYNLHALALQPSGAVYTVPVAAELESFASYSVTHVKWEAKKGVRRLEYKLPEDLTGVSNKVELIGPDIGSDWLLEGEAGTATCSASADQIRCNESLPGVAVDVGTIEARVQQGQLAPQKLAVTKLFNGDPLGVLQFAPGR